eukprot:11196240-Lingulodinium_polyedra.AAC.1
MAAPKSQRRLVDAGPARHFLPQCFPLFGGLPEIQQRLALRGHVRGAADSPTASVRANTVA